MQSLDEVQTLFNDRTPQMKQETYTILTGIGHVVRDWQETHQNVLALTWKGVMLLYVRQEWEPNMLKACHLYAVQHHRVGRTIYSASTKRRPNYVGGIDMELFHDDSDPIPLVVATALDWAAYRATLDGVLRGRADDILEGLDNETLMSKWGVSQGRVSQTRRLIHDGYVKFLRDSMNY